MRAGRGRVTGVTEGFDSQLAQSPRGGTLLSGRGLDSLSAMDEPDNLSILQDLGVSAAERQVCNEHFSKTFDLPA